jgi:hypothetical protein
MASSESTLLVVAADIVAVCEALSRSGFTVRETAGDSGTVVTVTAGDTLPAAGVAVSEGRDGQKDRDGSVSAAAILARAGVPEGAVRPAYPPRLVPVGW